MYEGHIIDVPGVLVGHAQHEEARTGVTVVRFGREGAVGGVAVRGASPGTRELALLQPENRVQRAHAIALCGGSAFGLDAAGGVMRYLEEQGIGFATAVARVPIVPAAVIFDLGVGRADIRPDAQMGYQAAAAAGMDARQGDVGAGTGATIGKGVPGSVPARGGVGSSSVTLPGGVVVGAIIVVNACGDVVDPWSGELLACGTVDGQPAPMEALLKTQLSPAARNGENTTIGLVATNARLDKAMANRLASVAHDGYALAIRPAHTQFDGDTIFAASTGDVPCEMALLEMAAVRAVAQAVCNAALSIKEAKA